MGEESIRPGDIILIKKDREWLPAVITSLDDDTANFLLTDGSTGWRTRSKYKITGKHIDIEAFFRQITTEETI